MLRALLEDGVRPDLVVGTSVGAINGAAIAAHFDPTPTAVERLIEVWRNVADTGLYSGSAVRRVRHLARTTARATQRTVARPARAAARLGADRGPRSPLPVRGRVHKQAAEHWFTSGPLVDAVLASTACLASCRRCASATSTSWTAAWSTPSPCREQSPWAPA